MTINPTALIALASKATPGPWKWSTPFSFSDPDEPGTLSSGDTPIIYATAGDGPQGYLKCDPPDAAYIAAASPDVISALCELTDRLAQLAVERYEEAEELHAALGEPVNTTRPMISSMRERIEALEVGLKEACDLAQYLSDNIEGDGLDIDQRIAALRALAEAKP